MGLFGDKKYGDGRDAPQTPKKPPVGYDSPAKREQDAQIKAGEDRTKQTFDNWKNRDR